MKTTEDYKKMGLFDACKTEKIINITNTTMKRYKKAGNFERKRTLHCWRALSPQNYDYPEKLTSHY